MQRQSKHRSRTRARALRGKRGVSEVLGTILILALTVTLFSSIFFFVNTFPKPAAQPSSQFQGQLYYSYAAKGAHSWTNVSNVVITHLGGPTIYGFNTVIYVVSQAHPQNTTATYTLTSGGLPGGSSASWGTGQVWNLSIVGDHLTIPDNITVTIVAGGSVVYRQTLPGSNPTIPPIFDQEGTSPGAPVVNSPFSIFVQITDAFLRTNSKQVYLNITTPGLSCTNPLGAYSSNTTTKLQFSYNSSNGFWFVPTCSTAVAGTYYVTAWATDSNPIQTQQNSIIFPVTVSSASGGSGGGSAVQVQIVPSTSVPVVGTAIGVVFDVTNNGAVSGTATVYFGPTASFSPTSATGTVSAGSTVAFQSTYTPPATSGTVVLNSTASIPGIGTGSAALTLTVFPHILLVSMNQPGGIALSKSNESANLASELTAAGFPFKTYVNSCTNLSLPTAVITSYFTSGSVVIFDFGTNSSMSTCTTVTSNSTGSGSGHSIAYDVENYFGTGVSFWVVGARAFSAYSPCGTTPVLGNSGTYAAYLQVFGISTTTPCVTAQTMASAPGDLSVTYTSSSSLLAQGISSPIDLNGNVTSATQSFLNYRTLTPSATAHVGIPFLTVAAGDLGLYYASGTAKAVAIGADPFQFGDAPAGSSWNAIGTAVTYNVMNYLCGLASTTAPTRGGTDFGIAGAFLTGTNHNVPSTILVNLRSNDASGGVLTVQLVVNGVPVLYQGSYVTGTVVVAGNGIDSWVTLTWQAPIAAPAPGGYVISFVLSTAPADYFTLNNQYNYYQVNALIPFS